MTAWPDIVAAVVAYLGTALSPVPVSTEVPDPRPAEFVQVRRVGGPALPPVRETVRLDTFTWAQSEARAYTLGGTVRTALWALNGADLDDITVYEVGEFMGPTMTADDETRTPQLWTTYELVVRADGAIQHG